MFKIINIKSGRIMGTANTIAGVFSVIRALKFTGHVQARKEHDNPKLALAYTFKTEGGVKL